MVNHGASRGCDTCRKRRKKCDEARPVCNRCVKAKRECLGYRDTNGLLFRYHAPVTETPISVPISPKATIPNADDVSLPVLENQFQELPIPSNASLHDLFYDQFCVRAIDRSASRGFLDGIDALIDAAGEDSDLAKAARVVVLAVQGNLRGEESWKIKARELYGEVIKGFKETVCDEKRSRNTGALMTAVMLGMYEVLSSGKGDAGRANAHVQGISALLSAENPMFDCVSHATTGLFQLGNPLNFTRELKPSPSPGVLCAPFSNGSISNLDSILIRFHPILTQADDFCRDPNTSRHDLLAVKERLIGLERDIRTWEASRNAEWRPSVIGSVTAEEVKQIRPPVFYAGKVEVFLDLFVACAWSTSRKTHLLVLDKLIQCCQSLDPTDQCSQYYAAAQQLADDILASVPFNLVQLADLQRYFSCAQPKPIEPLGINKTIGGLLMMYPVWVVKKMTVVNDDVRLHASRLLAWMNSEMGIGLAEMLGSMDYNPNVMTIAPGHILLWAGMLIQPV